MIKHFRETRRSAVAIMFALSLLPMVLLVGLAIDTAFYSQAVTQYGLAAEAAVTHAERVAQAAYTLDIQNQATNQYSQTAAANDAIQQGEAAGNEWFSAQLGPLLRASTQSVSTNISANSSTNGNSGAGFSGTVSYSISYPPIFSALFGAKNNWTATSTASAQTAYQYVEVLMMLDTSNSMLIGADPADILTLEENSVCPYTPSTTSSQYLVSAEGLNPLFYYGLIQGPNPNGTYIYPNQSPGAAPADFIDENNAVDADAINWQTIASVGHYSNPSGGTNDDTGTCASGYQPSNIYKSVGGYIPDPQNSSDPANSVYNRPLDACALACHTVTTKTTDGIGYYQDLYGMARRSAVTLRLDVVLTATENVIKDLYNQEQSANQFTVGVYQFNSDISPMVSGQTGDAKTEATANLEGPSNSALSTIQTNYDYNKNPSETNLPLLITGANDSGNTNFPKSASDLLTGTYTGGAALKKADTATTVGSTPTNPERNIFIVTDGFEDDSGKNGNGVANSRYMGEMTSATNEEAGLSTATCQQFKSLGFNVYVLYVVYYPLAHITYYNTLGGGYANQSDATDFPSAFPYNQPVVERNLVEPTSLAETTGTNPDRASSLGTGQVSPNVEALEACASPGDFYEASSSSDIQTAMNAMLQSAISSAITVTK